MTEEEWKAEREQAALRKAFPELNGIRLILKEEEAYLAEKFRKLSLPCHNIKGIKMTRGELYALFSDCDGWTSLSMMFLNGMVADFLRTHWCKNVGFFRQIARVRRALRRLEDAQLAVVCEMVKQALLRQLEEETEAVKK